MYVRMYVYPQSRYEKHARHIHNKLLDTYYQKIYEIDLRYL